MREKNTKILIPAAALVCVGMENSSGALPCEDSFKKNAMCDPYTLNFIEKKDLKEKNKSSKEEAKLYNRTASTTEKKKTTQKEKIAQSSSSKNIVKNAKDVTLPKIPTNEKIASKKKTHIQTYTYIVHPGDTLSKLAKEFNTKITTLMDLNNLESQHLIAGQKLKIPQNIHRNSHKQSFYVVKEGDTLEKIAKMFHTSVNKLKKYNHLSDETIRVGQKLHLKYSNLSRKEKIARAKKSLKRAKARRNVRTLKVTATAYTSHVGQTDSTPFLAAWNNRIRPGMKIIAVSRDLIEKYGLTNGKKVKIKGLPGVYTVKDKMNKRFKKRIDIYMGLNKRKALKWGKKKIVIMF